ncbi:unnamed protein product, partial [Meganyctiphanes norvegica]
MTEDFGAECYYTTPLSKNQGDGEEHQKDQKDKKKWDWVGGRGQKDQKWLGMGSSSDHGCVKTLARPAAAAADAVPKCPSFRTEGSSNCTQPSGPAGAGTAVEARWASELFNKGVALEQSGRLYEAIQFYRRAMTLVPDIEFRVHCRNNLERRDDHRGSLTDATNVEVSPQQNVVENEDDDEDDDDDDDDDDMSDLISRFTRLTSGSAAVCDKKYEQEATHISCLPPEMLERIMCWLIGSDLDLQTLEQVGSVCRGFYMIARNPELWHRACLRVWGIKCGPVGTYGSWRNMFVERPHPRYNGCYISCTTYFRVGESNFRDQNYQPWHVVRYYRYIRFFPEGKVFMLTCSDDPKISIGHLKNKEIKNPQVLQGNYRIHGSNVSLLFKRSKRQSMKNKKKIRGMHIGTTDVQETTFQLEFEMGMIKNNNNWQLSWRDYTIISVYQDERQHVGKPCINDVNRFPPLKFSRVKSYNLESQEPLM